MSQRDNFSGGFLLGAIVGGAVGGVIGALLASQRLNDLSSAEPLVDNNPQDPKIGRSKRQALKPTNGHNMEVARRSLEDKIAQLNEAIDDVRQQLGGVNGTSVAESDRSVTKEP